MTACDSMEWQGTMYTVSGIYYDTLQTSIGCDSIISIDLTINNSVNGDTTSTIACDMLYGRVPRTRQVACTTIRCRQQLDVIVY